MGTRSFVRCVIGIAMALVATAAFGFGGEDVAEGNPWHHEDITIRALAGPMWFAQADFPSASTCPKSPQQIVGGPEYKTAGFSVDAACAIAWHADFIDAYLYNPIFWVLGGYNRFRAAMVGGPELLKLHFDDTFTTAGMRSTWERYASGTLIGLYWASVQNGGRGDVAAAHNILGVSVHAVQDFYAHSNWVDDPERRCGTWLQTETAKRDALTLYSGAYEFSEGVAPHHHGAYSPSCSLLRGDDFDAAFETLCRGLSPLQNTSVCEGWRMCLAGNAVPVSTWGKETASQVHTAQQGIALDTIWMARIHSSTRKLLDEGGEFLPGKDGLHFPAKQCSPIVNVRRDGVCTTDADDVFAGTKDLAIRATIEWMDYVGQAMAAMGPEQAAFWERVKHTGSPQEAREEAFETLNQLPYLFLSAGPYPVANASVDDNKIKADANGWYLRLRIRTLDSVAAGTDAEIYAEVATPDSSKPEKQLLDRLPKEGVLKGYDDFEEGDDDVYVVGPYASRPTSIKLINDDAGAGDVLEAIWSDFKQSLDGAISDVRQTLIGLIAGKADYVGTTTGFLTAKAVRPLLTKDVHYSKMLIDGGDEGKYELTYRLRPTPWAITDPLQIADGWQAFEVQAWALKVIKESRLDRGTGGDEPFVVFLVSPLNGIEDESSSYVSTPLVDMQDGQQRFLPRVTGSAKIVKVPPKGGVVISVRAFESDSENQADRDNLRLAFLTALDDEEREAQAKFARALGGATGADWIVRSLEAFAFKRDATPQAGPVLTVSTLGEVEGGGESKAYPLDWSKVRPLVGGDFSISSWTAAPVGAEVLEGKWYAENFECDDEVAEQTIDITREGDALAATKTLGDGCVETGEQSWTGRIVEGSIDATLKLGSEGSQAPVVHEPGTPIYPDAPLEGAWLVEWHGTPRGTLTGQINLLAGEPWRYEFWIAEPFEPAIYADRAPDEGLAIVSAGAVQYESYSGELCRPDFDICWHPVLGSDYTWRSSLLAVGPDELRGRWNAGGKSGEEIWRRAPRSTIETIIAIGHSASASEVVDRASYGDRPVVFPIKLMRGYGVQFLTLVFYGDAFGEPHRIWMAPTPGMTVYPTGSGSYLCEVSPDGSIRPGTSGTFVDCNKKGGVVGYYLLMKIEEGVAPGLYTLFLDGRPVPFILEQPGGERPMTLAVRSCSVIEEVDGPQPGLIFRRAEPQS